MIIKGNAGSNVGWWGNHLQSKDNDRAEVMEIKGLLATDLPTALREMEAIAGQSRSGGNFMYAANINPRDNEHLTPEQWTEAVDTLEKNLGLTDHQRVVVEHEKEGRTHRHVIWNRVDVETLRVADIGGNYYTHERTARELEQRFGLDRTPSLHGDLRPEGRPERAPELSDIRAEARTGINRKAMKAELTGLWRTTDSGKAFAAAIEDRGYILAKGDRRDFVIVDHAGDAHSLARRIDGAKAADVRDRLAAIDRDTLLTVAEARAQQREEYPTREAALEAWMSRAATLPSRETPRVTAERDLSSTAGDIRLAWAVSQSGAGFAAALEDRTISLAVVTAEEAQLSHRLSEFARATGGFAPAYVEGELVAVNGFGGVYKLTERTTGDSKDEIAAYLQTVDRAGLMSVTDTRAAMKDASRASFIDQLSIDRPATAVERQISDYARTAKSGEDFAVAMAGSGYFLARATPEDCAALTFEFQKFEGTTQNLSASVHKIEAGEIVAVSSFGTVHRLNPHKVDVDRCETLLIGAAGDFGRLDSITATRGAMLEARSAASEHWAQIAADRATAPQATRAEGSAVSGAGIGDAAEGVGKGAGKAVLVVFDAVSKTTEKLADFVAGLFDGGSGAALPQKPEPSPMENMRAQRRALAALEEIAERMERGATLGSGEIKSLTPEHLMNIREKGDAYLRGLIETLQDQRDHDRDWGRERER